MSASTMSVTTLTLLLMSVALSQSQGVVDPATSDTSSGGVMDTTLPPTPSMQNSPTQISGTQNVMMNNDPNQPLNLNPPLPNPNIPTGFLDILNNINNQALYDPNSPPMDFNNQGFGSFDPNSATDPNSPPQNLNIFGFTNPGSVPSPSPGNTDPTSQDLFKTPMPSGLSAPSGLNDPVKSPSDPISLGSPLSQFNFPNVLDPATSLATQTGANLNLAASAAAVVKPGGLLSSIAGAAASNSRGPQGVRESGLAQLRRLIGELSVKVQQIITVIFRVFPIMRPLMPFLLQYVATGEGLLHMFLKPVTSVLSF